MDTNFLLRNSQLPLWKLLLAAISFSLLPSGVYANVNDLMNVAWEGFWHQSGRPDPLRKWTQPLTVRISGTVNEMQYEAINNGLRQIARAAGLEYTFLNPADRTENVLIEVVHDSPKVASAVSCITHVESGSSGIKKATITAKREYVSKCMLHEFAHLIGILGHPYGKTVLTYFNSRNELSDYDRLIIKARYAPEIEHGSSPFAVLRVIGERYIAGLSSQRERDQAQLSIDAFKRSILRDMERYAFESGEPPLVLYRSGLISMKAVELGRIPMQFWLGEALLENDLGVVDVAKALRFIHKAAAHKSQHASLSLAVRYQNGKGVKKDSIQAYSWYAYAASLGNLHAETQQKRIEESLPDDDWPIYRKAAAELQANLVELTGLQSAIGAE